MKKWEKYIRDYFEGTVFKILYKLQFNVLTKSVYF